MIKFINKSRKSSKFIKETLLLIFSRFYGAAVVFLVGSFLAKNLGLKDYGIYSYIISILTYFAVIFDFGFYVSSSLYHIANSNKIRQAKISSAAYLVFFSLSLGLIIVSFFSAIFFDLIGEEELASILYLVAPFSFSLLIPIFLENIFQSIRKVKLLATYHVISKTLLLLGLFFIKDTLDVTAVLVVFFSSSILSFIVISFFIPFRFYQLKTHIEILNKYRKKHGFRLFLGVLIGAITYELDKIILGVAYDVKDVGIYSYALSISIPIDLISSSVASSKYRSLATSKPTKQMTVFMSLLLILTAVVCYFFAYLLIHFYLGTDYLPVLKVLPFILAAYFFKSIIRNHKNWLTINGFTKQLFLFTKVYALISLSLNLVLVLSYGINGAVIATLVVNIYYFMHMLFLYKKKEGYAR